MHLLIPFASADAPACADAQAVLHLPRLEALLALLPAAGAEPGDEFSLSTPADRALRKAFGLPAAEDGHDPWAAREAASLGLEARGPGAPDAWAWITPCHWQVATDHITMGNPAALELDEAESRALLALMQPYFDGDGIRLHYVAPTRWLGRGELFRCLAAASLDRATGRAVDIWMPRGPDSSALRRLQSEMQMLLYTAAPNEARERRRQLPVNSFWVSATGAWPASVPLEVPGLLVLDALRPAALRDDWAGWAAAWQALDAGPIAEALLLARSGKAPVSVTLCGERGALHCSRVGATAWSRHTAKIKGLLGRKRLLDIRHQL